MTTSLRRFLSALLAGLTACSLAAAQAPHSAGGTARFSTQSDPAGLSRPGAEQLAERKCARSRSSSVRSSGGNSTRHSGPGNDLPLNKKKGDLSYHKPDKGSFQITEVRVWQATPVPAGGAPPAQANGDWIVQPKAIGEHWVCDGENVYEYRHDQKQMVVRPIPPAMRGKAIVDGPLPFLFGADAAKLKARYFMRAEQPQNPNEIIDPRPAAVPGRRGRLQAS